MTQSKKDAMADAATLVLNDHRQWRSGRNALYVQHWGASAVRYVEATWIDADVAARAAGMMAERAAHTAFRSCPDLLSDEQKAERATMRRIRKTK